MRSFKILHTADWHIGKSLKGRSRLEEQRQFLEEIARIADEKAVDMVLVAGDIYDKYTPSIEAEGVLQQGLLQLSKGGRRLVLLIAGNHDSPTRIQNLSIMGSRHGILAHGHPEKGEVIKEITDGVIGEWRLTKTEKDLFVFQHPKVPYPVQVIATPFADEIRLNRRLESETGNALYDYLKDYWHTLAGQCNPEGICLLTAHQFIIRSAKPAEDEQESEAEHRLSIGGSHALKADIFPENIQYVALGHLHRPHEVAASHIRYSGSPLAYSFDESKYEKKVVVVELIPQQKPQLEEVGLTAGRQLVVLKAAGNEAVKEQLQAHADCWAHVDFQTIPTPSLLKELQEEFSCFISWQLPASRQTDDATTTDSHPQLKQPHEYFEEYYMQTNNTPPPKEVREAFGQLLRDIQ
jgi:exonuclease SbcD